VTKFSIRALPREDIRSAVDIHLRAFPSFFLSFLGPRFLVHLYESFLHDHAGVCIAAYSQGGSLIGVVVGTTKPEGFFRRLVQKKWFALASASVGAGVRRPSTIPRLLRAVRYRGGEGIGEGRGLLSSIAVAPEWQGHGVGAALISKFIEVLKAKGTVGCCLTTDADNNDATNDFYRKNGWTIESEFTTPEGRRMNRYCFSMI
jgi:ribosomal protein S18 acetylase RimI-like enzyme